ncbi:MAG: response regulator transcription factor [Nitrospirae bacterium]|nr:response regulator transcription factor [Nitrospirota bacterium]
MDKKKIMIVEDEKEQADCLKELLTLKPGSSLKEVDVIHAASGSEAIELLVPDVAVVILDIILPDMSGLEVLRHIKEHYPSIAVIVVTAYGTEDLCLRAFRLGAKDYIKKPFSFDELLKKIEAIVSGEACQIDDGADAAESPMIPPQIFSKLVKAKTYIDYNYMLPITISELSSVSGLNRVYLCKYFRALTGFTCNAYIRRLRLDHAIQLLKEGDNSISDVSMKLGYSPKYFSTLFKKTYGVVPKKIKE